MRKEKQIIEIKECIDNVYGADCAYFDVDGFAIANEIYSKGYRKQSEGEWIKLRYGKADLVTHMKCSNCEWVEALNYQYKYCPHCGASMKGGAE